MKNCLKSNPNAEQGTLMLLLLSQERHFVPWKLKLSARPQFLGQRHLVRKQTCCAELGSPRITANTYNNHFDLFPLEK